MDKEILCKTKGEHKKSYVEYGKKPTSGGGVMWKMRAQKTNSHWKKMTITLMMVT